MNLQSLKSKGYKFNIRHFRYLPNGKLLSCRKVRFNGWMRQVNSKGGVTVMSVFAGEKFFTSEAICSQNDSFSYKRGVQFCIEDIEKQLEARNLL